MVTSGARPSALRAFTATLDRIEFDTLSARSAPLRAALDDFRATAGWSDWLSDVPPLDIDYGATRGRLAEIADFVDQVAWAFESCDSDPNSDTQVYVDDSVLDALVTVDLDEPVTLVQDGERWIFPGTDDADFVRVVTENGHTYLEVGVLTIGSGGHRTLRWERRELTDDQARNLVIRTGGGDDFVGVSPDVAVAVTIWTGRGDDAVGMPGQNVSSRLGGGGDDRIFTGEGNDRVEAGAGNDQVYAGDGNDFVDGQDGDDRIVGGQGSDVLYGGRGSDRIDGGRGDDYLEGGSDADNLQGGDGRDLLSGGRGDDQLDGGAGDDDLFGGRGDDSVDAGAGDDKVTAESGDFVIGAENRVTIELTGDPGSVAIDLGNKPDWMSDREWNAWTERIDSDIEFLRTTQSGRAGLQALDEASKSTDGFWWWQDQQRITILPYHPWNGGDPKPNSFDQYVDAMLNHSQLPGEDPNHAGPPDSLVRFDRSYVYGGDSGTVSYGQTNSVGFAFGPPVLTLQHELSHSFDALHGGADHAGDNFTEILRDANGNEIRRGQAHRAELNSVGFDTDGNGDPDTVKTDDGTVHPDALTENALRQELRRPWRDSYTMGTQNGRQPGEHITYENAT